MRRAHLAPSFAFVAAFVTSAPAQAAPPTKQQCADAATRGQVYRDDAKLSSAVEAFALCSEPACPEVVRKTCLEWLEAARVRLPSLRVIVHAADDDPVEGLTIRLDDRALEEGARASADVGAHTLRVGARGRAETTRALTLKEGERAEITIDLPPRAATEERSRPLPVPFWIASGVAVVGAASFVGFGLAAQSDADRLERTCAPACSPTDRDGVFRTALVADVSLGIAVVALGAAGYLFFTRPERTTRALTGFVGVGSF